MPRYVALLRGINVTGHNKIAMADLKQLCTGLGHTDVATYLQSGNLVFSTRTQKAAAIGERVETEIKKELGLTVRVLLRTPAELEKVISRNPFATARTDPKSLYVTFLATAPEKDRVRALNGFEAPPDEFRIDSHEVFLRCPNGYGRSKLNNTFWERKLAVDATTRNWNTVQACLELAKSS
jgi:uncharacterized protein (DUF1697 family)